MKKTHRLSRTVALAVTAALALQLPLARADIVDTETLAAQSQAQDQAEQDRAKVQAFLERATVKERLQAMGLSAHDITTLRTKGIIA